jgi:hypothetical protein
MHLTLLPVYHDRELDPSNIGPLVPDVKTSVLPGLAMVFKRRQRSIFAV